MRLIIQRVRHASVAVDDNVISRIGNGLLVFLGIAGGDTKEMADKMLSKLLKLRIFADENGKTNLSLTDVNGELMIISQFTLYADLKKGNRPSFTKAGSPILANELYEYMIKRAGEYIKNIASGSFGADMKVELTNDGPFTVILDSSEIF